MSEPARCPRCVRPVAVARATCLYCGAPLSEEMVARARDAAAAVLESPGAAGPAGLPEAWMLVLDLDGAEPSQLVQALGVPLYQARQMARRGGRELLRAGAARQIQPESERLKAAGLRADCVPGEVAFAALDPLPVSGGELGQDGLNLESVEGRLHLVAAEIAIVVKGPIVREYQVDQRRARRFRVATLEQGYRFHLHRRSDVRPIEIDPAAFRFPVPPRSGSSQIELSAWLERTFPSLPVDDGFRRHCPALAPTTVPPDTARVLGEAKPAGLRGSGQSEAAVILDNLRQFRYYSGWRGGLERRRSGVGPVAPGPARES